MSPTTTTESQTSSSGTPMVTTEKKHTDQIDPKEGNLFNSSRNLKIVVSVELM